MFRGDIWDTPVHRNNDTSWLKKVMDELGNEKQTSLNLRRALETKVLGNMLKWK